MNWPTFRLSASKPSGIVCFSWHAERLTLIHVTFPTQAKPRLNLVVHREQVSQASLAQELLAIVQAHQLKNIPCAWVLLPGQFELLLHDILDVPDAELSAAVRWRIKDLIPFSATDAAVDIFKIPPYGPGKQTKKMYVAAAPISQLQPVNMALQAAGLSLQAVNVLQLSLHQFAGMLDTSSSCLGILAPSGEGNEILISRSGDLYLARFLENTDLERLWLEIQRSYDFCESQLGFEVPQRLYCTPLCEEQNDLLTYLKTHLSSAVELLQLDDFIDNVADCDPSLHQVVFPLVGQALASVEMT